MSQYDPWGPISSTLYSINDSDLVENVIGYTGVAVQWPILDEKTGYSHGTRIRAYKPAINAAYATLEDQAKGNFAQVVAKGLLTSRIKDDIKRSLIDRLNDIGWTITGDGTLTTQDALLSEQFFPPGTHYDAYVAIRDVLEKAASSIVIVDPYMGSTLFSTLSAISPGSLSIHLLTTGKNLKPDFSVEASNFRLQYSTVAMEVRTTSDFHDRFIVIDGTEYYHIGASIKDAGKRAFLISRLEDGQVITALKQHIDQAWTSAAPVP